MLAPWHADSFFEQVLLLLLCVASVPETMSCPLVGLHLPAEVHALEDTALVSACEAILCYVQGLHSDGCKFPGASMATCRFSTRGFRISAHT